LPVLSCSRGFLNNRRVGYFIPIFPRKEKLATRGSLIPNSLIKTGSTVINQIKYPPTVGKLIRVISTVVEITFWGVFFFFFSKNYSSDSTTQEVPSGSATMG
jgi:hypothetical protein